MKWISGGGLLITYKRKELKTMKKFTNLIALCLAAIMLLAVTGTAYADKAGLTATLETAAKMTDEELDLLCGEIQPTAIEHIFTGHCTGDHAFNYLRGKLGPEICQFSLGFRYAF